MASAYSQSLTNDERVVAKDHRADIVALLNDTYGGTAEAAPLPPPDPTAAEEPTSTPEPEPASCPYCHQSPCVGPSHHAFSTLHWSDPAEIERRAQVRTAEMLESMRRDRQGW